MPFQHLIIKSFFPQQGQFWIRFPNSSTFHSFSFLSSFLLQVPIKRSIRSPPLLPFLLKIAIASIHPTLWLLFSPVCLCPAAPPLQAFPQNSNTLSSIYSFFQSMQSCVKTLPYISVQTMQFHVANSKYGPTIEWPLSPSPVVPAPSCNSYIKVLVVVVVTIVVVV